MLPASKFLKTTGDEFTMNESNNAQSGAQFIQSWIRQARDSEGLDDDIIELIDANREDSNIDEQSVLEELVEFSARNKDS